VVLGIELRHLDRNTALLAARAGHFLVADPSVIAATAVEEFIRDTTAILNMRRTVTADHELHGQQLHAAE
jgi:cytochrome P450